MQKRMGDPPSASNIAALVRSAFLHARLGHSPGLKTLLDLGVASLRFSTPSFTTRQKQGSSCSIEARSRTARIRTG